MYFEAFRLMIFEAFKTEYGTSGYHLLRTTSDGSREVVSFNSLLAVACACTAVTTGTKGYKSVERFFFYCITV